HRAGAGILAGGQGRLVGEGPAVGLRRGRAGERQRPRRLPGRAARGRSRRKGGAPPRRRHRAAHLPVLRETTEHTENTEKRQKKKKTITKPGRVRTGRSVFLLFLSFFRVFRVFRGFSFFLLAGELLRLQDGHRQAEVAAALQAAAHQVLARPPLV